jgi:hypothetical protein
MWRGRTFVYGTNTIVIDNFGRPSGVEVNLSDISIEASPVRLKDWRYWGVRIFTVSDLLLSYLTSPNEHLFFAIGVGATSTPQRVSPLPTFASYVSSQANGATNWELTPLNLLINGQSTLTLFCHLRRRRLSPGLTCVIRDDVYFFVSPRDLTIQNLDIVGVSSQRRKVKTLLFDGEWIEGCVLISAWQGQQKMLMPVCPSVCPHLKEVPVRALTRNERRGLVDTTGAVSFPTTIFRHHLQRNSSARATRLLKPRNIKQGMA